MIVNRTIWVNPVEPHPLSFRAAVGLDTSLNVAFLDQLGAPYDNDLAAQLQLTGRTTTQSVTYLMPATDIANGRARATIPAGALTDPNGYRLRLVGTMAGESALLAVGSVAPIAAAGVDTVPVDIIDTVDLSFEYDENVELDVTVWDDLNKTDPLDMTAEGVSVSANIYDSKGGITLMPFTVTVLDVNKVTLSLTINQVNTLPPSCWWTMVGSNSTGATTLCEGSVTITGSSAPPLMETTASYDYWKTSFGDMDPISGQIIHSSIAQNLLKVSKTTLLSEDLTDTLRLVRYGDQIQIAETTWVVQQAMETATWIDFIITPIAQSTASGTTLVTFRRPEV